MRLEITRKSDLALKALRALAATEVRTTGKALARVIGSTPGFTSQVMAPLAHAGWVSSTPGPTGGYRLESPGATATVRQLLELLEGPAADGRCVLEGSACPSPDPCALHDAWAAARGALLTSLDAVPVVDAPRSTPPKTTAAAVSAVAPAGRT